mmetsp:Transcript_63843/g.118679  ORF Transcript_63843/g.118679 Transcript_63843/m.118679 type:complete len:167 (+) Transcript_63843:85-585(+)
MDEAELQMQQQQFRQLDEQQLSPEDLAKRQGFRINWMNMRDATTGEMMWENSNWDTTSVESEAQIPRQILQCKQVSREINFSSDEMMHGLRLVQTVIFQNAVLEEWKFQFGFVIPHSTNTWQQTIEAADPEQMLPAELLSGNTVIDTTFYDGDTVIASQRIRLYYV